MKRLLVARLSVRMPAGGQEQGAVSAYSRTYETRALEEAVTHTHKSRYVQDNTILIKILRFVLRNEHPGFTIKRS